MAAAPAYEGMTPDQRGEELLKASETGNMEVVERLLAAGANKEAANVHRATPLFIAAANGHTVVVERLLAAGANKEAANVHRATPLFIAAANGHTVVVERLLAAGANKEAANVHRATPLFIAAANGHTAVVERLLAAGVNKEAANVHRATPLFIAAANGNTAVVELLLAAGANKEAANVNQVTPLYFASHNGHAEVVKRLLIARVDRTGNARGNMENLPLAAAVKGGHIEVIRHLLAAGVPTQSLNEGFMKTYANEEIKKLFNEFIIPRDFKDPSTYRGVSYPEVRSVLQRRSDDLRLYKVGDKVLVPIYSGVSQKAAATVVEVTPCRYDFNIKDNTTYTDLLDNENQLNLLFLFQFLYPHLYPDKEPLLELPAKYRKYLEKPELLDILRSLIDPTDNFQQKHRKLLALYDQNDPNINTMLWKSTNVFGKFPTQGVKVEFDYSPGKFGYYFNSCYTGHLEFMTNRYMYEDKGLIPRFNGFGIESTMTRKYSMQQVLAILSWTNYTLPMSFYLINPDLFKSIVNHPFVGNETIWKDVESMIEQDYSALYHAATPTESQLILYRVSPYWPTEPIRRRAIFPTSAYPVSQFPGQAQVTIPEGTRILDISDDFNPTEAEVIIFPSALTSPLDDGENHKLGSNMVIEPHENENVNEMGIKRIHYVIRNATEGNRNLPRRRRRTRRNNQNRRSTRRRRS